MTDVTHYTPQTSTNECMCKYSGMTATMMASKGGMVQVLEVLFRHGALVDKKDNNGNTALHYAYAFQHSEAANSLEAMGASCKYF